MQSVCSRLCAQTALLMQDADDADLLMVMTGRRLLASARADVMVNGDAHVHSTVARTGDCNFVFVIKEVSTLRSARRSLVARLASNFAAQAPVHFLLMSFNYRRRHKVDNDVRCDGKARCKIYDRRTH